MHRSYMHARQTLDSGSISTNPHQSLATQVMKKSFIDRIFPPPSKPYLPQYEQTVPLRDDLSRTSASPPRINMHDSAPLDTTTTLKSSKAFRSVSSASSGSPEDKRRDLQSAPLSASVLHHDDPFLPVERAARALQNSMQSLLDIQSRKLSGRMSGIEHDSVVSGGSVTPTQSVITPRSSTRTGTIPIRQPVKQKIGLRGARKGLARKMQEFAELRAQELQILEAQTRTRKSALERVDEIETRKHACEAEIDTIRQEDTSTTVSNLRNQAQNVQSEIEELEHRLLELRVRQRHLNDQADQVESSRESKMSSFQGTIAMIDKETREFLRRPPVSHALADGTGNKGLGMYALKPDRRTLEMAKEQWISEQEVLSERENAVENERSALLDGESMWSAATQRIECFEEKLRVQTASLKEDPELASQDSLRDVLNDLDQVTGALEADLLSAESNSWNLLVCALGAELEAFYQAREMLTLMQQPATEPRGQTLSSKASSLESHHLQNTGLINLDDSVVSNKSLEDTLKEFSDGPTNVATIANQNTNRYESEDDEPPADFLLSR